MAFTNAEEVIKFIADEAIEFVDIRFTDLPGIQQHFSITAGAFEADPSRTAWPSTVRRCAASSRSTSRT